MLHQPTFETHGRPPVVALSPLRAWQRWPLAAAALAAAAFHVPVIGPHLAQAPYMGVLFILLTVACTVLAAAVLVADAPVVYLAAAVTCGLAVVGYALSRVVAFPMLADDVGNWLEPLGVASILAELVVVGAAISAIARRRRG